MKDFFEAIQPALTISRLFGLSNLKIVVKNDLKVLVDTKNPFSIIIPLIHFLLLAYFAVFDSAFLENSKYSDGILAVGISFNSVATILMFYILYTVNIFARKRIMKIFKQMIYVDDILQKLAINVNYTAIFKWEVLKISCISIFFVIGIYQFQVINSIQKVVELSAFLANLIPAVVRFIFNCYYSSLIKILLENIKSLNSELNSSFLNPEQSKKNKLICVKGKLHFQNFNIIYTITYMLESIH